MNETWTVYLDGAAAKLIHTRSFPLDADLRKLTTNAAADPTDASVGAIITQVSVTADTAALRHFQEGAANSTGSSEVIIHRGAPAWESHPELRRGIVSVMTPGLFKDLMRPWTWEIPAKYLGRSNEGDLREFMLLRGGSLNWTLALKFPRNTPDYVFERVALGFGATPYAPPEPKPEPAPPPPDQKPKSAKKALRMRRRS